MSGAAALPPEVAEVLRGAWVIFGVALGAPLLILLALPLTGLLEWSTPAWWGGAHRRPGRPPWPLGVLADLWRAGGPGAATVRSEPPPAPAPPAPRTAVRLAGGLAWALLDAGPRLLRGAWRRPHLRRQAEARAGYRHLDEYGDHPPRWLVAGAAYLSRRLRRLGIRDRLAVKLVGEHPRALAYYFFGSQFAEERHVLRVTANFLSAIEERIAATPDGDGPAERSAARSAAYLMAHEYAHGMWELAWVLGRLHVFGSRLRAAAYAPELLLALANWRTGPQGMQEAFCDDFAAFLIGEAPLFEGDDSQGLRAAQAPALRRIAARHGRILASLDEEGWLEVNRTGLLQADLPWVRRRREAGLRVGAPPGGRDGGPGRAAGLDEIPPPGPGPAGPTPVDTGG